MIKENLVFFKDSMKDQDECLDFLINELDHNGLLYDKKVYKEAVLKREEEFSTAVGFNVAIPHGMSDACKEAFITFLKLKEPTKWGKEEKAVNLIFLIGVPEKEKNITHLKYISQISRHLIDEEFRNKLNDCENEKEAFRFLDVINDGIKGE